jgi:hypothetical protein
MSHYRPSNATTSGLSALALTTLLVAGCGGGGGSSSISSGDGSGSLSLGVTDAPVDDAQNVFVQFSSVTLIPSDSDTDGEDGEEDGSEDDSDFVTIEFDEPQQIDLLDQQDGNSAALIENEQIEAGEYDQIRLGVDLDGVRDTYIVLTDDNNNTIERELSVPSGAQTGLKLVSGFTVEDGGSLDLTIDFDLRKSIVRSGNNNDNFKLKPALRLINNDDAGDIDVTASSVYVTAAGRCNEDTQAQAAYIYEGGGVTPDDVNTQDDSDVDPLTTVSLDLEQETGNYVGTAGFLEPGTYTAAFTCDPENDEPEQDDSGSMTFYNAETIEVEAARTSAYDLDGTDL